MEQTQQQQFQCTGDCLKCFPAQRAYCASQHAYNTMKMIEQMRSEVLGIQQDIKTLSEKIEAIQASEASVFDPNQEIAEEASAAGEKTANIINNL